jgi:hypothetical protein
VDVNRQEADVPAGSEVRVGATLQMVVRSNHRNPWGTQSELQLKMSSGMGMS